MNIGSDIIDKRRIAAVYRRYGSIFLNKCLHPQERQEIHKHHDPIRFISMRWAAKEALAKALGCGLRHPVYMNKILLKHKTSGAPYLTYDSELERYIASLGIKKIALSLSDEKHYALAVIIIQ